MQFSLDSRLRGNDIQRVSGMTEEYAVNDREGRAGMTGV